MLIDTEKVIFPPLQKKKSEYMEFSIKPEKRMNTHVNYSKQIF